MFAETIQTFFLRLKDDFLNFHFIPDILDILLVALLVYAVIVQLRKTQSIQVVKGIILVAIVYGLVSILNMSASSYIFNRLLNDIIIIVVILFSGEIRQALEHMGTRSFGRNRPFLSVRVTMARTAAAAVIVRIRKRSLFPVLADTLSSRRLRNLSSEPSGGVSVSKASLFSRMYFSKSIIAELLSSVQVLPFPCCRST